ncbi:alpha/beta fold hydrolase [Prescottella agglutinans]|uniref:Pimeloyl-ACP methyl ester carboxylesterase n=1 Tax=Prescottella agglutinans TaxID=1644129 RepID=A0ABT6M8Y9_9NOCA|nr:alpha/beta hydrolase [Prescottella agglutinans]MDH6280771.1 pimeloyl-ACP methyl ester carboxylesterase [Prescottella agglutinans]
MSAVVLVSGAWHGGWCWRRVSPILQAAGHEVFTPTLTGLSDRAHLLNPSVGLETHIEDVVRLIDFHGLEDVTLVGHSYAGQVVTGVASRRSAALAQRVYLDAFVGDDGDAAIDLLPPTVAGHYRDSVRENGFGWLIPPRSLQVLGIDDQGDLDWLTPRLTPHPWKTYTDRLVLNGEQDDVPASYVECTEWMRVFKPHAERAAAKGWTVREVPTGHEAMVTAPDKLAAVLLDLI